MENYLMQIEEAVYEGEKELVADLVQKALDAGTDPQDIISQGGVKALNRLGDDFNNFIVFLPELILAGECMKSIIKTVAPHLSSGQSAFKGKIVIGTAKGDLHDIGKNLVSTQLAVHGYDVVDLGVDVPTNKFIETAEAEGADIVVISSLLTTSQYYMEEVIKRLVDDNKRDKFKVAVGGGPINAQYAEKIGADGYSRTAVHAVTMADRLMEKKPGDALVVEV